MDKRADAQGMTPMATPRLLLGKHFHLIDSASLFVWRIRGGCDWPAVPRPFPVRERTRGEISVLPLHTNH